MKIPTLFVLMLACAGALMARPGTCGPGQEGRCAGALTATEPLTLSAAAGEVLRFQLDEERMAGDLYRVLGEKWPVRPFKNIPRAEARHHKLLLGLAQRAGLESGAALPAGRYATVAVQERYDALLARGQTTLIEALKVGALVEEQDIADLRALIAATDSVDIKAAAAALESGSHNHLRAFVRNLRARGVEYIPQVLSAPHFAAILTREN